MFKSYALDKAIEIAKESARGGNTTSSSIIIQNAFGKIVEIAKENGDLQDD